MQVESMEKWLSHHINTGKLKTKNSVLLDVGAYRGDFTKQLFLESDIDKAILFEPNSENYLSLKSIFSNNTNVAIINCALGDKEELIEFHCDSDLATGSVLNYQHSPDSLASIKSQNVQLSTMDQYLQENNLSQPISIIKIDTQGFDLRVLKGAEQTIALHSPWIIVELIFVPLYQNQSHPHEISAWLSAHGYSQAGMFNIHVTSEGWLAFADGVFVPTQMMNDFNAPYYMNHTNAQLLSENTMLRSACEERLELINRLHREAAQLQEQLSQRRVFKRGF